MAGTWILEDVVNTPLTIFLLQLALTLVLTRALGGLLSFMKQPQVIGEIIAGVLLGPSVFGRIPGFSDTVFPTKAHLTPKKTYDSLQTFGVIANMGLILFMFMMGLELDRGLLRRQLRHTVPIFIAAAAVPFAVGCGVASWLADVNNEGQPDSWKPPSTTAFTLFAGASMSFTAFPVLASILLATGLIKVPLGILAMSSAALDDVSAWCLLAVSSSFAKSGTPINGLYTLCLSVLFVLVMVFVLRPALYMLHTYLGKRDLQHHRYYFCLLMVLLIGSAYCTEAIGIHSFFGAFLMGFITPHSNGYQEVVLERMELVVREVLLPLYFANSGIRTNIGTLDTARYWGITLAIIVIAIAAKFAPACLATKLVCKRSWRFSVTIGFLMNTRGLVEIIALNIGLSLGILSTRLFTMLVLMAIATTIITSPCIWLVWLRKYPDGLEPEDRREVEQFATSKGTLLQPLEQPQADAVIDMTTTTARLVSSHPSIQRQPSNASRSLDLSVPAVQRQTSGRATELTIPAANSHDARL